MVDVPTLLLSVTLDHRPYHFLYSTLVQERFPQQPSGPLRPLVIVLNGVHQRRSLVLLLYGTPTYFALSLQPCFPQSPTMSHAVRLTMPRVAIGLGPATADVRFPTSSTGNGSDPMYVLDLSVFLSFAVGD